jgi:hypothetical protein
MLLEEKEMKHVKEILEMMEKAKCKLAVVKE